MARKFASETRREMSERREKEMLLTHFHASTHCLPLSISINQISRESSYSITMQLKLYTFGTVGAEESGRLPPARDLYGHGLIGHIEQVIAQLGSADVLVVDGPLQEQLVRLYERQVSEQTDDSFKGNKERHNFV